MKKQKVINATYRKDSNTFPDWLKYEVTLIDEDGIEETIPAYGRDLQDALSRVVHDKKVVSVENKVRRIPEIVWILLWFGYVLGLIELTMMISDYGKFNGLFFLGGFTILTLSVLLVKRWFRERNNKKELLKG